MIRTEVIIAVKDVERSSKWYQQLLGCKHNHGGHTFEILTEEDGTVILCLHKWGEHDHPTLADPEIPIGNGVILYIRVDDLDQVWRNAILLNYAVEQEQHLNHNSGKQQFILRDLDSYYLIISAF